MFELILSSIALGLILGVILGWLIRSLFIYREIERIARESWKQAATYARHGGKL